MHLGKRKTRTHVGTQSTPQYFNTEGVHGSDPIFWNRYYFYVSRSLFIIP